MNRYLSPWSVRLAVTDAVIEAVYWPVFRAVSEAVHGAVSNAVLGTVSKAVAGAVYRAVSVAVRVSPPHPNIDRLVTEVRRARARWGAT